MHKYTKEALYIAGPECFYQNGYELWDAMGKKAEYYGFGVTMPTKNELLLNNEDLRKNADVIFKNCAKSMKQATAIVADLELFRGSEPDGGTLFEMGMAYALGLRCYGFTRDKRNLLFKHQEIFWRQNEVWDKENRPLAYQQIPFCPSVTSACRVVEGSFDACLRVLMMDIDEERKGNARIETINWENKEKTSTNAGAKRVFLATQHRFSFNAEEQYEKLKNWCAKLGFEGVSPLDEPAQLPYLAEDDAFAIARNTFERSLSNLRSCDMVLCDLNDFHGYEPNSDISFESGYAWQIGKKCFGFIDDAQNMRQRIPNQGANKDYVDVYGNVVENFDYPINLMFASSMPIYEGDAESAIQSIAQG